ncbi:hypothetical protein DYB28_009982 [Aphanomyces astaci]|uniref:HTH CENPB-type domain-containing protein n=1 Tax=Aphanomyces astaci TaxID=112090 RepID=A0A9X8H8N4_APHAT|nr:hypothetical protein DYB28_009982 [Aphanomyces astaci]
MSRWLNTQSDRVDVHPSHKSAHKPRLPDLESRLMSWIQKCEEWKVPIVSGPTIRAKAMAIQDALRGSSQSADLLDSITFSNGWLQRFQLRHNLKSRRVYGEAASASQEDPQDAGVIQAFKNKIGALRALHIVEKFDKLVATADESDKENFASLVNKLHEVSLLQAMEWAKEAWHSVTQDTIANCWRHTGILDEEMYELIESMNNL